MTAILLSERIKTSMALIVNTYFGIEASSFLDKSSYLLFDLLACLRKTVNYVIYLYKFYKTQKQNLNNITILRH